MAERGSAAGGRGTRGGAREEVRSGGRACGSRWDGDSRRTSSPTRGVWTLDHPGIICAHSDALVVVAICERSQEVILNDRLGKKLRIKCNEDDTIGDLKKLVAAQTGEGHPQSRAPRGEMTRPRREEAAASLTLPLASAGPLAPAHPGTRPEKIRIQKWYTVYKDHITLGDCT